MRLRVFLAACFIVCAFQTPPLPSSAQSAVPCEERHRTWSDAQEAVRAASENYRALKEESVTEKVHEAVRRMDRETTTAQAVQLVLARRREQLERSGAELIREMGTERQAFDELRRCVTRSPSRQSAPASSWLAGISKERAAFLARIQDLLLDEAYAQYKGVREPNLETSSSSEPPRSSYSSGRESSPGRYVGYGAPQMTYPAMPQHGYFR